MQMSSRSALAISGVAILSPAAVAGTVGTTMPVTAVTVSACAVAASPLVFGTLNQLNGGANDSQTTVTVTCTPGTPYDVGLDQGAHATGGVRRMAGTLGSASIPYMLYSNASRSAVWGNTVGTNTVGGTAGLLPSTLTVYGRVPAGTPAVAADAYSDAVTVTVTF
jgi:spore coat protein U-like protein